jgi:hypothetical protein
MKEYSDIKVSICTLILLSKEPEVSAHHLRELTVLANLGS